MTDTPAQTRARRFLFFRRTGQAWKLNLFLCVVLPAAALQAVGEWQVEQPLGIPLLVGGSLLGGVAIVWAVWSLRCPSCKARPAWMAMNGKLKNLAGVSRCPSCDFEPPATPDERG